MNSPPARPGIADGVLAQIRRSPAALAVLDGEHRMTYGQLASASAAVADGLRAAGVRPGQPVAICLPRGWQLVSAMLGILRLGGTVVPLDADSPVDRQRHMLADSASVALIHQGGARTELADRIRPVSIGELLDDRPPDALLTSGESEPPTDVALLFYTSGTTGRPKGVQVRDAGVLRLAQPGYLRPAARYGCLSNPAFDALSFEVWTPLLTGASCVILDARTVAAPTAFAEALRSLRIDAMFVTAALFNAVVEQQPDCFSTVGQVLVGGEQLNAQLIRRWYQANPDSGTVLYNGYGPTEATTFALSYPIPRDFAADLVPIGRPLPGTEALPVLDGSRLAGPGELAELYLGGDCLAAGYQNLPAETAERFVRLPWYDGGRGRYYRTGDLVRSDAVGLISYVGRTDRQVKVRGFRIEPGEVERQLLAHPSIRQAYACSRRDDDLGSHQLLGYLVLGGPLSYPELDQHLADTLPTYMRPHRIYLVEQLPLTANGKVDQDALLALDLEPWQPTGAEPAGTDWQREVAELVAELLGGPAPGLDQGFIAAGGDSLSALRLRFAIARRWGCQLPQALVLRSDLAGLAQAIAEARAVAEPRYPPPPEPAGAWSAPATSEQQRLWLLQQQHPQSCAYNVEFAFQLTGSVDSAALRTALARLVVRHPALRTGFAPGPDGLRQLLGEPYDPWLELPDGSDWRAEAQRLFAIPFDLAEPRMFQAGWLPSADGGVLLLRLHHIAVDGWSLNLLFEELSADYQATAGVSSPLDCSEGERLTPLDYSTWQADWFDRPAYRDQRAGLREHYAELEETSLPLPIRQPEAGAGLLTSTIDPARCAQLDQLGTELGLTRFQLLLGVFSWALYAVTGRARPLVASPVAGRPVQEFEASVGMFANTMLLPLTVSPRDGLREQLLRQADGVRAVLDRQDVVLADVLDDHDFRTDGPLFDFLFVLDNTDFDALTLPGCRPVWLPPAEAKCALTLSVVQRCHDGEQSFDCLWEYAGDRLEPAEVAALSDLFGQGLDRLVDRPDSTVAELVGPYRAGLPDPGRGAPLPLSYQSIAEGFATQVARTPDAIALVDAIRRFSYAELDGQAQLLADQLRARFDLPAGDLPCQVALRFQPSAEHIVALLALARLHITAVPVDPAYPLALRQLILDQARPICVLTADAEPTTSPAIPRHQVVLADAATAIRRQSELAVEGESAPERPLYTLFTSGSTGTPKGVQVPDRTLCNLLQWQRAAGGLPDGAVTQQFSMLSFDVSFQEIFGTLCGGGCLHLIQPGWRHDMPALLGHLESAGIERIHLPYVALQLLAEHGAHLGSYPSRLRDVVTAGEQLLCTDAVRGWFAGMPGARLFNHYGPSETHVVSGLCLAGDPASWPDRPPIGTPVAGAWLRVVDEADQPVPPDCPGELLIGGLPAVPCYLDDPAANAASFVELPDIGRCYRSGDLARFDRHGLLHFIGRDDQQVKLSGHRLELGQVEAALAAHPAVGVAVVVRDGEQLVACLEFRAEPPAPDELAAHLAERLPSYVRVDRYRQLSELPRTASGKLDRRRALHAAGSELAPRPHTAPELTEREAQLTALFQAVIGRPVGPDQRFFDAGASSLGLMRFHLRATAELGVTLSIADLFEHVTIRRLARFIAGSAGAPAELPYQTTDRTGRDEPIAVIGMAVRLPGADDLAAFAALVDAGGSGIDYFEAADGLVGARSQLTGPLAFDAEHFGISRQEARLMDPQQRHLLMACVQALAHAGITDPAGAGLIASCGENTYFQAMLREADPAQLPDGFQLALHHDKDFLATKVAYQLGLTGPAFTVQAACASSLVAVHVATGLLRQGDSQLMLAGGVLVDPSLSEGYCYRPQHIFSPDGHCRSFSDDAGGTVGASGVGVVVLKPLRLAQRDGDTVYALVTGSAVNNDGAGKLSYTAPALAGQREVIRTALRRSGRRPSELGYIEAHGTGTELGDPVEVGALRQAYQLTAPGGCALSSVKSQLGHLGAAAGVVGLIRASLAVYRGLIPPTIDFHQLNPRIGDDAEPFRIPTESEPWPTDRPRVAAVSSFGIGGTNAHLILEAGFNADPPASESDCMVLSASSAIALHTDAGRIADYLADHPERYRQVLRHLQAGRPAGRWRAAAVCPGPADARDWLRSVAGLLVVPTENTLSATGCSADQLVTGWLAGDSIQWPDGPAQPPWDFPPPSFALVDYDFARAAGQPASTQWPARLPESDWLHQPQWVRLARAGRPSDVGSTRCLVLLTAEQWPAELLQPLRIARRRVVTVTAAGTFAELGPDRYQLDPTDPRSLTRLLAAVAEPVDWLHALPLAVTGPVNQASVDRARWACLDSTAALLQASADVGIPVPRIWLLSQQAQPVQGEVGRPELGLLAGPVEVIGQEHPVRVRWLDLPDPDPAGWLAPLAALLLADPAGDRTSDRLALRDGYWWRQALLPVSVPPSDTGVDLPTGPAVHLVLGGTGGIGSTVAGWLLARSDCRLILLSRRPELPAALAGWADRIRLLPADLATQPIEQLMAAIGRFTDRLDGVVHAIGRSTGGLIVRRTDDPVDTAKLRGALLIERLLARYQPAFALYCSSMSVQFGGSGQFDYAAGNGLLDGFARYRNGNSEHTLRLGIDWDVWREVGMARHALPGNPRHQAHLATGLTVAEAGRLLDRAWQLGLPHLLVSTTDLDRSAAFYHPVGTEPDPALDPADALAASLRRWLGLTELDPTASLYELGADSLTLLDLVAEVHERYRVELSLSRFSHRVSLAEVLEQLAERTEQAETRARPVRDQPVSVQIWQAGTGPSVLCLLHPVGGDIQAYRSLAAELDQRLTVCLIADPGLQQDQPLGWSLADRAERYYAALHSRFPIGEWQWRLAGWSFGGWLAMGLAAAAEAAGRPAEAVYLVDPPAPDAGPALADYAGEQLQAVFAHELAQDGTADRISQPARAYAERLARCCRANLASMADYLVPTLTGTPARLWLAGLPVPGLRAPAPVEAQAQQWQARLAGLAGWQALDTTHYGIVRPPHARLIAEAISTSPLPVLATR